MFRTLESFKYPLQLGVGVTLWRVVEFALNHPRVLATVDDENETRRTFLLSDAYDLLDFVRSVEGKVVAVRLLIPPDWSESGDWALVPICRIEHDAREGALPSAVVKAVDGRWYGGHPLEPTVRNESDSNLLVLLAPE